MSKNYWKTKTHAFHNNVAATAAQSASLQFIAPYTGCSMLSFSEIADVCFNYL